MKGSQFYTQHSYGFKIYVPIASDFNLSGDFELEKH